ncbi:protein mab-21-like 2 [Lethenteron reissneri]|uniref:protein mab-21-like 2 n=1 Tax=Lethenteron reissneri TaxID=7753 RepID=UPI002AB694C3|nr:protein mab-21-like 2 [Lethenteron reissneri]
MDEREEDEERARLCRPSGVMMPWQQSLSVRLDAFHRQHCAPRPELPCGAARDIARAVATVLREVGAREPRFVISPGEHHPHRSPHRPAVDVCGGLLRVTDGALPSSEFEMLLYLNLQTSSGVFSLVDEDNEGGGRALLKLADGRKRSMSLWVEFITASGSLSARKLRSRLHALVAQALGRRLPCGRDDVRLVPSEAGEVLIGVPDHGVVKVTPAFRCSGTVWPRCASQWFPQQQPQQQQGYCDESLLHRGYHQHIHHQQSHDRQGHYQQKSDYEQIHYCHSQQQQLLKHYHQQLPHHHQEQQQQFMMMKKMHQWPGPRRMAEIKAAGFTLLSAEDDPFLGKGRAKPPGAAGAGDGDAWLLRFTEAEELLLEGGCRRKCLSVLAALRERHLPGALGGYLVRTLVLHECEKHPRDAEWADACLGERLLGALLQLVSCLRCRRCPHFFVRGTDLLRGGDGAALERAAEQAWRLARLLIAGPASVDTL